MGCMNASSTLPLWTCREASAGRARKRFVTGVQTRLSRERPGRVSLVLEQRALGLAARDPCLGTGERVQEQLEQRQVPAQGAAQTVRHRGVEAAVDGAQLPGVLAHPQ